MDLAALTARVKDFAGEVTDFPVVPTAATLWERFRQDRLGITASSLTFTTTLALVPFFAVVLAVFTAFPIFGKLRDALEQWLIDALIPPSISRSVLDYLTQFATKASELGVAGLAVLFLTVLSLVLTIDHTLNDIWRVSSQRTFGRRLLVYWGAITLGPLALGASLAMTSYVVSHSRGWLPELPGGINVGLDVLQFLLLTCGLALMYRTVPNTPVQWRHAFAGALFVAVCTGIAKQALAWYLSRIPTYSLIYGAFATVPILLLWIYTSWLIVLLGAVVAAYLPSLLRGVARRGGGPGWDFQLAVELLRALAGPTGTRRHGRTLPVLARALGVDTLQLGPVIEALLALDWIGRLEARTDNDEPRYVLLADPATQPLRPLIERLLLAPDERLAAWWARLDERPPLLADVLGEPHAGDGSAPGALAI